ncbi:MAG: SDR family oxidoreductase [Phycisphaerae bacterium]|nr:SDR family oxidoreductase [Phycisphaerae bacterium]
MSLKDRVLVVTGGTGALGTAVCKAAAASGAWLHVTYRRDHELPHLEALLHDWRERVRLHRIDVTSEPDVSRLFHEVDVASKRVDALLNVVGGFAMGPIEQTTTETFDAQIAVNLRSVFLCCREAIRRMRPAGRGRIVNVAARAAIEPPGGMAVYSASKSAVVAMTKSLAAECAGSGVSVNVVLPSIIDTPANRSAMPDANHRRWVPPSELARVMLLLCDENARMISGAAVPVYGEA